MPLAMCSLEDREFAKFVECHGDTAVRVVICDDLSGTPGAGQGTPFFLSYAGDTIPGTAVSAFSFTVPASTRRDLKKFNFTSFGPVFYEIKLDGSLIASGRVSAGNLNHEFTFDPVYPIPAGGAVTVDFTGLSGSPVQCVEAYLSGYDVIV